MRGGWIKVYFACRGCGGVLAAMSGDRVRCTCSQRHELAAGSGIVAAIMPPPPTSLPGSGRVVRG